MSDADSVSCSERVGTGEPEGEALSLFAGEVLAVELADPSGLAEPRALALGEAGAEALALWLPEAQEVPVAAAVCEGAGELLLLPEELRVGSSEGAVVMHNNMRACLH